jgi:hypothetical protein
MCNFRAVAALAFAARCGFPLVLIDVLHRPIRSLDLRIELPPLASELVRALARLGHVECAHHADLGAAVAPLLHGRGVRDRLPDTVAEPEDVVARKRNGRRQVRPKLGLGVGPIDRGDQAFQLVGNPIELRISSPGSSGGESPS